MKKRLLVVSKVLSSISVKRGLIDRLVSDSTGFKENPDKSIETNNALYYFLDLNGRGMKDFVRTHGTMDILFTNERTLFQDLQSDHYPFGKRSDRKELLALKSLVNNDKSRMQHLETARQLAFLEKKSDTLLQVFEIAFNEYVRPKQILKSDFHSDHHYLSKEVAMVELKKRAERKIKVLEEQIKQEKEFIQKLSLDGEGE